jgi:hypothetical protein
VKTESHQEVDGMPDDRVVGSTSDPASTVVGRARYEAAMAIIRYHEDPELFYEEACSFVREQSEA